MELSWTLLTHGHLPMNKFWGETSVCREALCTSTLIRTEDGFLLVDPPAAPDDMPKLLHDKAGLKPGDIRHVFLTHHHLHHRVGLDAFPRATWWISEEESVYWRTRPHIGDPESLARFEHPGQELLPGIRVLSAPGHTPGSTALLFEWRGQRVAVAGDAAVTEEYFRAQQGYYNSTDETQAHQTLITLTREADWVIPGHGNAFHVKLVPGVGGMWTGGKR